MCVFLILFAYYLQACWSACTAWLSVNDDEAARRGAWCAILAGVGRGRRRALPFRRRVATLQTPNRTVSEFGPPFFGAKRAQPDLFWSSWAAGDRRQERPLSPMKVRRTAPVARAHCDSPSMPHLQIFHAPALEQPPPTHSCIDPPFTLSLAGVGSMFVEQASTDSGGNRR